VIEDTLAFKVLKAMKSTRPVIWPALSDLGLHAGQELLLSQLWREDGISQTDLIERLGVEPPTVSKTLNRLERAGFVRRESAGRGRAQTVYLTEAGRALQEPVEAAWRRADEQLTMDLSEAERETFADLLTRVIGYTGSSDP
jgi:DNA-binding MarR family transcriptional regulator